MTREPPTSGGRSAQRRFTLLARLWVLVLLALAGALLYVGQVAVALGVIAIGLAGFGIVFDARRPWWGPGIVDGRDRQLTPSERRRRIALVVVLVLVTAVISTVVLLSQR